MSEENILKRHDLDKNLDYEINEKKNNLWEQVHIHNIKLIYGKLFLIFMNFIIVVSK